MNRSGSSGRERDEGPGAPGAIMAVRIGSPPEIDGESWVGSPSRLGRAGANIAEPRAGRATAI
jgi:hypothetical protein